MCGRYRFTDETNELRQMVREANERLFGKSVKTGEIYPSDLAVVIVWEDNKIRYLPVWWGFPKHRGKGVMINARSESDIQKPMFTGQLLNKHCVVPSTGFFEWRREENKSVKEKILFTESGKDVLYMAGILNTVKKSDGTEYDAFKVLTTAANESVSPVHHRMPVVLQYAEIEAWLRDGEFMQTVLDRVGPALEMTVVTPLKETEYEQTSLFRP